MSVVFASGRQVNPWVAISIVNNVLIVQSPSFPARASPRVRVIIF